MATLHPSPSQQHSSHLVNEWRAELSEFLGRSVEDIEQRGLNASDFTGQSVSIELADGSCAEFRYSFVCMSLQKQSIVIFTEHCGHHLFSWHDAKVFIDGVLVFEDGQASLC